MNYGGTHEGLFVVNERKNKIVHLKQDLMRPFSLSDKIIYTIYRDREGGILAGNHVWRGGLSASS